MSTQKRFEIGVDYEGVSSRHLQVNEEVIFSNEEASRIFMPECGSFYVDSLKKYMGLKGSRPISCSVLNR